MKRLPPYLPLLLVAGLALMCGARAVGYPLIWDDVVLRDLVRSLDRQGGAAAVLRSEFLLPEPTGYYRPVVLLSLLVDERISSLLPDPYHLTNILLHVAVSLLVLHFIRLVTASGPAALAGSCLFAVHPAHVESVAFVSGRTDLWAALFCLVAAICAWKDLPGSARRSWILRTAGWAAAALAVLSKEVAVVLPLVFLAGRLPLTREGGAPARKHLLVWFLGSSSAIAAAIAVRLWWVGVPFRSASGSLAGEHTAGLAGQLGTMLATALTYVRLLVLPWPLKAFYTAADVRVTGAALLAAAVLLGLILVSRGAFPRGSSTLALAWIAGFLAPVLLVPSTRWAPVAERFLYLPSVGYAILAGCALVAAGRRRNMGRPAIAAAVVLVATCAGLSVIRTGVWRDGETLFRHIADSSPDSHMGHLNLGIVRQEQGRIQEAVTLYRRALDLKPDNAETLNNLGNALFALGRRDEALPLLAEAVRLKPGFTEALVTLGTVLAAKERYAEARAAWERAVGLDDRNAGAHYNLGLLYLDMGLTDQARRQHRKLQGLDTALAAELARQIQAATGKAR